ncbi:hypothetical protein QA597_09630 [Marinilabiliaceae bacterium ANBcel2]|nr:hypothetical protein [Marinilabiliaceae bacterium ANBcel2]
MKCSVLIIVFTVMLSGCTSCGSSGSPDDFVEREPAVDVESAITISQLMDMASDNVGEEVIIEGVITHVCRHSGKRCFINDTSTDTSIRVEAKGNIGGFYSELKGNKVVIKGSINENRLSEEYIDEWEQKTLEEQQQAEVDQNQCSAELANIEQMRNWMAANDKNFYSVFFIEGVDYEIVE